MKRDYKTYIRKYHEAKWDEELIFDLSVPGRRGILVAKPEERVINAAGNAVETIPENLRRKEPLPLPEVHQMRVVRHYVRLTQEILGAEVTPDISEGTTTMKYSPKVQEMVVARNPDFTEIHPLQPEETLQGTMEIYHKTEKLLCEISGMDAFTFQPGGGATAVYTAASIARAYHRSRGDFKRDEIITTIFSHPCDAAAPATAGFKVVTLMVDETGCPSPEALKAVLSDRTACIFITNPEDTGIFNPRIKEFVDAVHEVGGLAYYDQANANGMLGVTRAREAGFDFMHYNLHKTFSSPHGAMGPGCGACGVREFLKPFLPSPRIEFDGEKYYFAEKNPLSIGQVRQFIGNAAAVVRTYMWIMQHGSDGVREAAVCSVLNNQYLMKHLMEIKGITVWYAEGKRRLEQVRYSLEQLKADTGFGTTDVCRRLVDFGLQSYHESHHPYVVPEPFTLEPCESYSKEEIDEYVAIFKEISREAYEEPELIRNAPMCCPIHRLQKEDVEAYEDVMVTYQQMVARKNKR